MSDHDALLTAIIANSDDDTPRLVYADWLDENAPDKTPSPAVGPSARAEYIRVQCRLAGIPFDDPDYPELIENEQDLAEWLQTHSDEAAQEPDIPEDLEWRGSFDSGEERTYCRGFPDEVEYTDYDDEPSVNVQRILLAMSDAFARSTFRTLRLEGAYGGEIAGLLHSPIVRGLRGLSLSDINDDNETDALRGIATSPHLRELKRLNLDFFADDDGLKELTKSAHLEALETLTLDYPSPVSLKSLTKVTWFRNLRSLRIQTDNRDVFKTIAEFPEMPKLIKLAFRGSVMPTTVAVRKFASSDSFPQLKWLEWTSPPLTAEHIAILARGSWPLRRLTFLRASVRKPGAEALADAAFAESLRVLELTDCEITAGGVEAIAKSKKLSGLKHLDLSTNPVGVGGLLAIARSDHLRELRSLSLSHCNDAKALLDATTMLKFLSALDMPELRHLKLNRLPVGIRGARMIATRDSFTNLTRLSLCACALREKGTRAIVESHMLPHLTALDLADNGAGNGVAELIDPKILPRLGCANLCRNRIQSSTLARLRKRPGMHV